MAPVFSETKISISKTFDLLRQTSRKTTLRRSTAWSPCCRKSLALPTKMIAACLRCIALGTMCWRSEGSSDKVFKRYRSHSVTDGRRSATQEAWLWVLQTQAMEPTLMILGRTCTISLPTSQMQEIRISLPALQMHVGTVADAHTDLRSSRIIYVENGLVALDDF